MEALRYLDYLKEDGHVVVNDIEIPGMPITSGNVEYPAGITEELKNTPVQQSSTQRKKPWKWAV